MMPFFATTKRLNSKAARVLLIDDDRTRRYALAQTLRADGCDVQSASGHESWLSLFKDCLTEPAAWVSFVLAVEPDVVVLAIEQPLALATLAALARQPLTRPVPVLVLGDAADKDYVHAALSLGAVRLVERSSGFRTLGPLIETLLAESRPRAARTGAECRRETVN